MAGQYAVSATVVGSNAAVAFTLTNLSGVPKQVVLVSGAGQMARSATSLTQPIVVKVTDDVGNPVVGAPVTFLPGVAFGSAVSSSTTADVNGNASTGWTLGATAGLQWLTVSSNDARIVVSAIATMTDPGSDKLEISSCVAAEGQEAVCPVTLTLSAGTV